MPDKHALLSASSAHRWLHCPPSARLCEEYEDKGSDFERDCRMLELGVLEREEFRAKWILNNA